MRFILKTLIMAPIAGLAACGSPNVDAIEENAIVAEGDTRDAADQRATNLDRLAGELDDEARNAGNAGSALRNEAAVDRVEADAVRTSGEAAAEAIETNTEAAIGVNRS